VRNRSDVPPRSERPSRAPAEEKLPDWQINVPNDPINEQTILGAELACPEVLARLTRMFPAEAFYAPQHKVIQAGLIELVAKGLEYDPAAVLRLAPDVDIRILEQLRAGRPDVPSNLDFHVEMLAWDWRRAQATRGPLAAYIAGLQNPKEEPERLRALARQVGASFEGATGAARFLRDSDEVIKQMMKNLRGRVDGEANYAFGIPGLDLWEDGAENSKGEDIGGTPRIRPGAAPGLTTILTGMSGAGKTTVAAHAILGLARQKRRVLVGAWEVRAPMTLELITTLSLKWSRSRILDGRSNLLRGTDNRHAKMSHAELAIFEDRARLISKYVTFVENPFRRGSVRTTGKVTNDDYLDVLEEHVEASGCDVCIFDLFDRCLRWRKPDDEQEALYRVLEFTDRLQVHTILVHQQLLKGDDVRADKRPSIAGLKGSSAYTDVGALILAPHLPARFKNVPDDTIQIFGLKQRYGPPFAVEFAWDPDTGQMSGGVTMPDDSRESEGSNEAFPIDGARGRRRRPGIVRA
jgi:replicative DNA helicase